MRLSGERDSVEGEPDEIDASLVRQPSARPQTACGAYARLEFSFLLHVPCMFLRCGCVCPSSEDGFVMFAIALW